MTNRRQYLVGAGTAAATLLSVGASNAIAQNATPEKLYITEVYPEAEYLVVENVGDGPVDLTNYYMNFEYNGEVDQIRQFGPNTTVPDGQDLTVEAGERFVIATGAADVADADVTFDYDGSVIRNDGSDTFAIFRPDGETVVAEADKNPSPPPTDTPTPEKGEATTTEAGAQTTTETDTATQTTTGTDATTKTSTRTATSTPESGTQTATTTAEPTETSGGNATETSSEVDVDDGC